MKRCQALFLFFALSLLFSKLVLAKEKATLAGGCFWGVEEFFRKIPGVVETGVGFSSGAESVEVIFDEKKVSYEKILELFFKMHDPTTLNQQGNDKGLQYRSAIFYNSEKQKLAAEKMKLRVEKSNAWKAPIVTEIAPAGPFTEAPEDDQKYLLRNPKGYDNHFLRKIKF